MHWNSSRNTPMWISFEFYVALGLVDCIKRLASDGSGVHNLCRPPILIAGYAQSCKEKSVETNEIKVASQIELKHVGVEYF